VLASFAHAVQQLVIDLGYPGLFLLIVLESTMVPIPSLLVMPFAGYLAATGAFSLPAILLLNAGAALTGSLISYALGAFGGKPLLLRYGKYVFVRAKDLEKTHEYFEKHGGKTIFIARFLPVVRHLISIPAGIARMPLAPFSALTVAGASCWGGGLMVLGYWLKDNWETIEHHFKRFDLLVGGLVVVVLVALAVRFYVKRKRDQALAKTVADAADAANR
jgi:membrane protein DedA with SNARE-associated domain